MTPGVLTCLPVTPLRDVARMMARHHVHAIVVFGTDDRLHPWGVVSDLDLISAIRTRKRGVRCGLAGDHGHPRPTLEHAAS